MIFQAKKFKTRSELDTAILSQCGNDIKDNRKTHTIKGKREELKNLSLSDTTSVWGVQCEITGK